MVKNNRVSLSYTKREWIFIEKAIKDRGNKNGVTSHILKEVKKLDTKCSDLNDGNKTELTKVIKRDFYPPQESVDILNGLSKKLNIPTSTIVSRLIISPLLVK